MTRLHRTLRKKIEKAILDYRMIEKGDRILLGVSGGSDSLALLKFFSDGFIHVTSDFSFMVGVIDLGFNESNPEENKILESHFNRLNINYQIVKTQINQKAFDPNAKKNPCFICSMFRRRYLYELAHRQHCNKIAYGHHKDDIIETLLLNIIYGREINTMNPVQEIFQGSKTIIRPLTYVDESLIKKFARESKLPIVPKHCPMDGRSRRQKIKKFIANLQKDEKNANIRENIFKSINHVKI